jgi:hypothetical protein
VVFPAVVDDVVVGAGVVVTVGGGADGVGAVTVGVVGVGSVGVGGVGVGELETCDEWET